MISNAELLGQIKDELKKVKTAVGEKGAPKRAAEVMAKFINKRGRFPLKENVPIYPS